MEKILVIEDSNVSKEIAAKLANQDKGIVIVDINDIKNIKGVEELIKFDTKEVKQRIMIQEIPVNNITISNPKHNQSWKPKHKRGY